ASSGILRNQPEAQSTLPRRVLSGMAGSSREEGWLLRTFCRMVSRKLMGLSPVRLLGFDASYTNHGKSLWPVAEYLYAAPTRSADYKSQSGAVPSNWLPWFRRPCDRGWDYSTPC